MVGEGPLNLHPAGRGAHGWSSGAAVYRVGRRIARGGMGELYLGLQEGIGGFERFVVIKRVYPHLCEDPRFTRMLLEEARLAASIQHPNVVQVLDIGRDEEGYFLVMEYLSGESLSRVSRLLRARGQMVPPTIACHVAAEIAAGLHCAHTATDPEGCPRPIVHRDVTPSNLIVCFNGVAKVVDFGVAKALLNDSQTRDVVKGKVAYLTPEQLREQPLDGRADVFQLGICLHELLTGTRLFSAATPEQSARAVLHMRIAPPSELVPGLPKMIDEVVLWALEREPEHRPPTADAFCRSLLSVVALGGGAGVHDTSAWMQATFAERLAEHARFERACAAELRERRSLSNDGCVIDPPVRRSGSFLAASESHSRLCTPMTSNLASTSTSAPSPSLEPPRSRGWGQHIGPARARLLALSIVSTLIGAVLATTHSAPAPVSQGPAISRSVSAPGRAAGTVRRSLPAQRSLSALQSHPAAPSVQVALEVRPAHATIDLDGLRVGRGSYRATLAGGGLRILTVRAPGYATVRFRLTEELPPANLRLVAKRSEAGALKRGQEAAFAGSDNPDPWAN